VAALRLGTEPGELARERKLRGEDLLAALPGLPYLASLYELAASLVPPGGRLVEWERPWRRGYRKPSAKARFSVALPAGVVVRNPEGRVASYLLLPDVGGRPLDSFRPQVAGLAAYRAYRRGEVPDLVVATSGEERALAWEDLLEDIRRRAQTPPLPGHVCTWQEVGDGLGEHLPLAPRSEAPVASPPLAAPPATPEGALPRPVSAGLARPRRGWANAGVLGPDTRALLELVGRHPFLRTPELAAVLGWSTNRATRVRARALAAGLVGRAEEAGADAGDLSELTTDGLGVVAAHVGLGPAAAARALGLSGGGPDAPFGQRRDLAGDMAHTLGVNSLFAGLYRVCADWEHRGHEYRVLEWRGAAECAAGDVRPDGYGVLGIGPVRYEWALEYDRGTMRRRGLMAKFGAYNRWRSSGAYLRRHPGYPTLLVITTDAAAEERLARRVLDASAGQGARLPVLLTTEARVAGARDGLLGPIWREPVDRGRRHWLVRPPRVTALGYGRPPSERVG
jgi:hypothetical protein